MSTVSRLAVIVTILFIALAVVKSLTALSLTNQIQLLDAAQHGATLSLAQAEAQDNRQRLLGAIDLTLVITASVLLLVWTYRANRNARALGTEGMQYTPGWSVGWFFVPLAGLAMPYYVFRELWQASTPEAGGNWRRAPMSPVVAAWWLVTVLCGMIQYSPWQVVFGNRRISDVARFDWIFSDGLWEFSWGFMIAEVADIAACVLTIVVVISITNMQEHKRATLTATQSPSPMSTK